jgi:DNA processing protein
MGQIKTITFTDKEFPALLKKIPNPPKILYYRGVLPAKDEKIVAVVGTRRPSDYGQRAALEISGELADAGITIISGMAPGIDTFAHTACTEKGKRTIAVLGSGLDERAMYPKQNIKLSREIVQNGGCLISEYPPTMPGMAHQFPERNRIVSGLSSGVLVIEAKEKSGSLITADLAKLHRKKLFAVPGPIYTANAKGPNKLIKEGATLIESSQDILDVLGIEPQKAAISGFAAENPQELAILTALKEESLTVDKIIEKTKLQASSISSTLALMEISGKIRNLGGNVYSIA